MTNFAVTLVRRLPGSANHHHGEWDLSIFPDVSEVYGQVTGEIVQIGPTENDTQWHRGIFVNEDSAIYAAAEYTGRRIWKIIDPAFTEGGPNFVISKDGRPPRAGEYCTVTQVGGTYARGNKAAHG